MSKLQFHPNKTLKLTNVLSNKLLLEKELELEVEVQKMNSYIRGKGAQQIGPLIQYTKPTIEENKLGLEPYIMMQSSQFINNVEHPYTMQSSLRVTNCMYCRYIGAEEKIRFAYDKINLEAFENDVKLVGDSYTIFVNRNEDDDTIIADVFMPIDMK